MATTPKMPVHLLLAMYPPKKDDPLTQKKVRKVNEEVCVVWDMNAEGWRSFRWDKVIDAISSPRKWCRRTSIMLKANEASAGKYWIVNSSDGLKVGTL